jgi:hypothetical protein
MSHFETEKTLIDSRLQINAFLAAYEGLDKAMCMEMS